MSIDSPLIFEDGELVHSGWTPPTSDDIKELNISCAGANELDIDRIVAMPARDTFLYRPFNRIMKKIHGPDYKWLHQYQKFGTCVGQMEKHNNDDSMALSCLLYMDEWQGRSSVAGAYTFSRVEIGGQPGRWEGSNVVRAKAGSKKYGILLLKDLNLADDDRDNDENLAMKWTASKQGVPALYEDKAALRFIENVVEPESIMMAAKLVQAGVCFGFGSTYIATGKCNSQGISPCRRNRGGHAQAIRGVRYTYDGKPHSFLQQQTWYPGWAQGPKGLPDQPPESVWVSAADFWIQIQDGDCRGSIGVHGLSSMLET